MPDPASLLLFAAAALALIVAPGPAVLYIVARSIDQGRLAGIVSTLGIAVGALVHVLAAAVGLSALLLSSALWFAVVKYLGATYLVYLGVQKVRGGSGNAGSLAVAPMSLPRVFGAGVAVNILNPKTALFFFAFLPQFADPTAGPLGPQIVFLGLLFVAMALVSDSIYALVAGSFGRWLRASVPFQRVQNTFSGWIYIVLGLGAALADGQGK